MGEPDTDSSPVKPPETKMAKPWYTSMTIWGVLASGIAAILGAFEIITPDLEVKLLAATLTVTGVGVRRAMK